MSYCKGTLSLKTCFSTHFALTCFIIALIKTLPESNHNFSSHPKLYSQKVNKSGIVTSMQNTKNTVFLLLSIPFNLMNEDKKRIIL